MITASRANRGGPKPLQTGIFEVVQTIPAYGTTLVDPSSPIILFFNDVVDQTTVTSSTIQLNGTVSGLIPVTASFDSVCSGNTVAALTHATPLALNEVVTVDWNGVKSASGTSILPGSSTFDVAATTPTSFGAGPVVFTGTSFPASGVVCVGDCAVLSGAFGSAPPILNTTSSAYFSSGYSVTGLSFAIADTTSTLTVHGLTNGGSTLSFSYRFISAEFPDYIGSEFDDVFTVMVSGPSGAKVQTVNSVNQLGANMANLTAGTFGNDGAVNASGDTKAMMSAELTGSVNVSTLGTPLTVSLSASDVGDSAYDTVVELNNIRIQ